MHSRKDPVPVSRLAAAGDAHVPRLGAFVRIAVTAAALLAGVGPATGAAALAQTQGPPRLVPDVDLERYAGTWYELGRFPNRFQKTCLGDVTATYTLRPDGRVTVTNRCRTAKGTTEASGVARRPDPTVPAKLEVRFAPAWLSFLPIVWGDYWIVDLASDYSTAVVGSPDRQYLWILSRTPHVDAPTWARLVAAARSQGFDESRIVRTPHQ